MAGLLQTSTASTLDEAEQHGRQIYLEGTSPRGGEINAVVGDEATLLPAMAIPCANCHGYDGLGRPEGGVIPTDIRWSQLIKNYGHVHEHGRRHGPFDEQSLGQSINAGLDPAGNRLDTSMPVYIMGSDDLADLVAYLKVLENDLDPGLDSDSIRVASLLPRDGRLATLGSAMEAALRASFADLNERGGVFGRRIELVSIPLGSSVQDSLGNVQQAFDDRGIFALVGGYTVGIDEDLLALLRWDKVPLIGPFTLDPGDAYIDGAAFYLYPGFPEQVRALVDQAIAEDGRSQSLVIALADDGEYDELAVIAEEQLRRRTGLQAEVKRFAAGHAASVAGSGNAGDADGVLFLGGSHDLDALLEVFSARGEAPRIYALSSLLSRPPFGAPASFNGRIFVAHPTTASDMTADGRERFVDLAKRFDLPAEHVQAQVASMAAAAVLIEGLRRAGRDLSRSRLIDGIEELYNFQTGLTPPLVYGPNQRIGAPGAHILVVDLEKRSYTSRGGGWRLAR